MDDDVPSAHAVFERVGPNDGHRTTVYLVENRAVDLPRELRPVLLDHFGRHLPGAAEVSDELPHEQRRNGAFGKVVFLGFAPWEALRLVRKIKNWFFQNLVSSSVRRAERRLRKQRKKQVEAVNRRSRYNGRKECKQQVQLLCHQR